MAKEWCAGAKEDQQPISNRGSKCSLRDISQFLVVFTDVFLEAAARRHRHVGALHRERSDKGLRVRQRCLDLKTRRADAAELLHRRQLVRVWKTIAIQR